MRKILLVSCLLIFWIATSHASNEFKTYRNYYFGYSINYPAGFKATEIYWVKDKMGVRLEKKKGEVTVQAMPAGTDYAKMPFADYVKIAASVEIQNFNKLLSIEAYTSDYGVKGYKTYWEVISHQDPDSSEKAETSVVGPIFYFPPKNRLKVGDQPVKTIMISPYGPLSLEAEDIAGSFRYLNTFMRLFKPFTGGKSYFVKVGETFKIELTANPTTGYTWNIEQLDESLFKVVSSGYKSERTDLVGSGGTAYWEIMPLKAGKAKIGLDYYRSWEGKDKSIDHFQVSVIVVK